MKNTVIFIVVGVFASGILAAAAFTATLEATNTTEFCTSCHSMQWVEAEWKESVHYTNLQGIRAQCHDCHVPKQFAPKLHAKLMAAKDVWHEILGSIDSQEKFEAQRWRMANKVWSKIDSDYTTTCQSCHRFEAMDIAEQDRTAKRKHTRAHAEGENCIACHTGVAHKKPKKPKPAKPAAKLASGSLSGGRD